MSEYTIWRHKRGLKMHSVRDQPDYLNPRSEVRYAVGHDISEDLRSTRPDRFYEVPIRCVRNVQSDTEDLPRPQWADGGTFPVGAFLELYEPVS